MPSISVEVIVYRAEAFYFADMHEWQSSLAMRLTPKYHLWRPSEETLAFASDAAVEEFWQHLDETRMSERSTIVVSPGMGTGELIDRAMAAARGHHTAPPFEGERFQGLYHLESGASVELGRTVGEYLIDDGDHLGLIIEHPPTGMYCVIPVPNSEAVFAAIRSADEKPPEPADPAWRDRYVDTDSAASAHPLRGALLYTDEDQEIATYVRKHFASLSEASGPNLQLYVVEQPAGGWREASRYWKGILDERLQREWALLGWLRTKPYTAVEAYRIARRMNVYPDQLPCLVLFEHADSEDRVVFPLLNGSARFFRSLFGGLQRLIVPGEPAGLSFTGVRRGFDAMLDELRGTVEATPAANRFEYRFEGQTVFINKPAGDVTLSNFQNQPSTENPRGNSE